MFLLECIFQSFSRRWPMFVCPNCLPDTEQIEQSPSPQKLDEHSNDKKYTK